MVDQNDGKELESRPPTVADLVKLCAALNEQGARYLVIGGMAMIQAGFVRATEDIDILIEMSKDNQTRVRKALMALPDQAVRELGDDDLDRYTVVRVADEFVVDVMGRACGIDYTSAIDERETVVLEGIPIPLASPELLWKLKQTGREKDELDRMFLKEKLKRKDTGAG